MVEALASAAVVAATATVAVAGWVAGCGTSRSRRSSDCRTRPQAPTLRMRSSPGQAPCLCTAHHSSTPCHCPAHMGGSSSSMRLRRQAQAGRRRRWHPLSTMCSRSRTRCPTHHHARSRRGRQQAMSRPPGVCHLPCRAGLADAPVALEPAAAQVAKQMVQMTRNTPCCTQAAVAACSCTWS